MASHILVIMIVGIALTIIAARRRLSIQPPLLLAGVGLLASLLLDLPEFELPPDLLLSIVLPPLIYSAAQAFSFVSFMRRLRSILNLGVLLVLVTAFAIAGVVSWVLPAITLPVALIVGAVVAPPDAVSAVAIGSKLGLPQRLMTVLKGESLINDAAALTIFTLAVAAATGAHNFIEAPIPYFLYAFVVGMVLGLLIAALVDLIRRRLENATLVTALAILTPFACYGLAEELGASGVMAVVFAGFALGHNASDLNFAGRLQEREVWHVVDKLLETFVFGYLGLQFPGAVIDAQASGYPVGQLIAAAAAVLVVAIVVRIAFVMGTAAIGQAQYRRRLARPQRAPPAPAAVARGDGRAARRDLRRAQREARRSMPPGEPLSWRENVVLAWTGMRGVVTVAAAAGTPLLTAAGDALPGREIILPLAFSAAIGTLLLQGLTLPWLIRLVRIDDRADVAYRRDQFALARRIQNDATVEVVAGFRDLDTTETDLRRAQRLLRAAQLSAEFGSESADERSGRILEVIRAVLAARRKALIGARDGLLLDDEILREVLEQLDLQQAVVARRDPETADAPD
ncbi:MAG: cation:proton antiporter [Bauldia sp.]